VKVPEPRRPLEFCALVLAGIVSLFIITRGKWKK